jgi:16S rRNA (cytidine1402-2'-O)-methyltransferase
MKGKIYLIPVTLGGNDATYVIPDKVLSITRSLRHFITEDLRSARRYLKLIDRDFPIDDIVFFELNKHTILKDVVTYLDPANKGFDTGLMSEAGLPGVADPGAAVVEAAHKQNIQVVPLSGPSSIIMALISSGLNGQNFTFNGYLPINASERITKLKELERKAHGGYAQIFMETPYRCQKMLEAIITSCNKETRLCIAADITLENESIKTMTIEEWKKEKPALDKRQVIFIIQ